MASILVVEDDSPLRDLLDQVLSEQGFLVRTAADGELALAAAFEHKPDVVLLDLMLPGKSGFEVLEALRADVKTRDVAVIIISASGKATARHEWLERGADEYVTKPFDLDDLNERIKQVLAWSQKAHSVDPVTQGLDVNLMAGRVRLNGHDLRLTPVEFALLVELASYAGHTRSPQQLAQTLWGDESLVTDVARYVERLRAKIESDPSHPRMLIDASDGYHFIGRQLEARHEI